MAYTNSSMKGWGGKQMEKEVKNKMEKVMKINMNKKSAPSQMMNSRKKGY